MIPVNVCNCKVCQSMCKTPCLGTPKDINKLAENGFSDRLEGTLWGYGVVAGTHQDFVPMVQPRLEKDTGYCTFFKNGLCELHDLGLKPTEGALVSCRDKPVEKTEDLKNTTLYKVVAEWEKIM